jgi:hypothetical protein
MVKDRNFLVPVGTGLLTAFSPPLPIGKSATRQAGKPALRKAGETPVTLWGPAFAKALRRGGQAVPTPVHGPTRPKKIRVDRTKSD